MVPPLSAVTQLQLLVIINVRGFKDRYQLLNRYAVQVMSVRLWSETVLHNL
jgi:hypothetical protein